MTRLDKLSREVALASQRLESARELLCEMRHAHNEALRLLCLAWAARMKGSHE